MQKVRVGIVGIGNIGSAHAESFSGAIENAVLTAVCDISQDRREFCEKRFPGVAVYSRFSDMLRSDIDAVIIAVPHRLHCDMARQALCAGKHVLVEKPLDVTLSKTEGLSDIAKKSNLRFAIMLNQRTNPLFIRAREIVKSGGLGELKRSVWIITNWYRSEAYYRSADWRASWAGEGGGVLVNQAPHQLDLWQWICGMPCEITAFCDTGKYHDIEVEDDATIFARYENGATGAFITSTGEYPGSNRFEISGTRGKIVLEAGKLRRFILECDEREFCAASSESFPKIPYKTEEFSSEDDGSHRKILQNFINAITNGEELISPADDGKLGLSISNAAYLSAWNGGAPVKLPFDTEKFDKLLAERSAGGIPVRGEKKPESTEGYLPRWQVNW